METGVLNLLSCEICVGIDSPNYADKILSYASSVSYTLTAEEIDSVLNDYVSWKMDGSDTRYFGKTALAWQSSLKGNKGLVTLPIPTQLVLSKENPWIPYVNISPISECLLFSNVRSHLDALNPVINPILDI